MKYKDSGKFHIKGDTTLNAMIGVGFYFFFLLSWTLLGNW